MKTGDIVLVPFLFAELNNIKLRPAVVVCTTTDKYKDVVLSVISSVLPSKQGDKEIFISPNKTNKLKVKSVIKVDRIVTIKKESIVLELGRLSATELATFKLVFKSLVELPKK
jgi:mRNA interferase MazF